MNNNKNNINNNMSSNNSKLQSISWLQSSLAGYLHIINNVHNVIAFIEVTHVKQDLVTQKCLSQVAEHLKQVCQASLQILSASTKNHVSN